MTYLYRADLHVHSRFSNKSPIWAIRKINCPESYTSPEFIYTTAIKMGMDYVTITDHDTIGGALEIAHLPGAFISVEVSTYFPENNCKIHVVVLDISENTFKDIVSLSKNVYELVAYLRKAAIIHFVAHPLFDMNGRLTEEIVEKMLLLFDVFEVKNGIRAGRFNQFIKDIIKTNRFKYSEAIHAFYGTYEHSYEKFGYSAGLRIEQASIKGHLVSKDSLISNQYFKIYPTLLALSAVIYFR